MSRSCCILNSADPIAFLGFTTGTNSLTVSENVAFNVIGYCYYLEDGVEENNKLLFNLAAHIHSLGPNPPNGGGGQTTDKYVQGPDLTLPADVTASGFYITNVHNDLIGNAASGVSVSGLSVCNNPMSCLLTW